MRVVIILLWAVIAILVGDCGAADSDVQMRPADPGPPLVFTPKLTLTRSGVKPRELKSGDHIATNDEIRISITPKEDVFLDVGYCDGANFMLNRDGNPLRVERGQTTEMGPLTIGPGAKPEVIYVIVSNSDTAVTRSSPDLLIAMIQSRHEKNRAVVYGDCEDEDDPSTQEQLAKRPAKTAIAVVRYVFPRAP